MRDSRHLIQLRSHALAFAVVLSPVFFQTAYSCDRGNALLSSLEVELNGQNEIGCFDPNNRNYAVTTSGSTAIVTVQTQAASSTATYQWTVGGETVESGMIGVGGGQVTLNVPNPGSTLRIGVRAAEGALGNYVVDMVPLSDSVASSELLATWGGPSTADSAQLAVDPNGDAVAVWNQFDFDTSVLNLYASQLTSGVWGNAELLETDDGGNARTPQVAVASNGDAVVVWSQHPGNIYANRLTSGVWSGPELVETNSAGAAVYPQVAVYPNGDAVAVWQQYEGSYRNIYANRLTSGVWGVPELLETENGAGGGYPSAGWAEAPQIAVSGNGDAVAVWEQRDDSALGRDIYANRLTSGVWSGAELLELVAGTARHAEVAVDPSGNAVVVWEQSDRVYARRLAAGVWAEDVELLSSVTSNPGDPQVAIDPNGNAVVVWSAVDSGLRNIYANRWVSEGWAGEELLETNDAADASGPRVAVDPNGDAAVVWSQRICFNERRDAYLNRLTSGVWGEAELLETVNTGHAGPSQVAVNANGDAVAVWWLLEDTQDSVYATQLTSGP